MKLQKDSDQRHGGRNDPIFMDLLTVFMSVKGMMHDEVAQRALSMTHFIAMCCLQGEGSCKMSKLTEFLDLTHGASTGVIDRLTGLGLVARTQLPQDRRVVHVSLTAGGEALLQELHAGVQWQLKKLFATLDPSAREVVGKGLHLLAAAMRAQAEQNGEAIACSR